MARFGAKRPSPDRKLLPVIAIMCDDRKTAPAYFKALKKSLTLRCNLNVDDAGHCGANHTKVLELAKAKLEELSDSDADTVVWVLIDLEMRSDSAKIAAEIQAKSENLGIAVALSQPCFEVWTLVHFLSTGSLFNNCSEVLAAVEKQWQQTFRQAFPRNKAQADYTKIASATLIQQAITNAKIHTPDHSQSWTQVWQVVENILRNSKRIDGG
jgi:hypothetical protein